jgi:hypothetical protein
MYVVFHIALRGNRLAKPQLNNKMKEVIGGKDVNTALLEAEEQANKAIQTAIGKK